VSGVIRCPLPSCGGVMVKRTNRAIGSEFLGCSEYPACTETQPIPESVWMRQAGSPELPLFDDGSSEGDRG
jgi:ssDNA-binding Zn-finger/Zn-ribbon topoisomerase 1